jgi:hypothetical protein
MTLVSRLVKVLAEHFQYKGGLHVTGLGTYIRKSHNSLFGLAVQLFIE